MRRLRRWLVITVAVGALSALATETSLAGHDHWLLTPGTCVEDIASGQTEQVSGGGYHQYHENVHLGTPGTFAFAQDNNPVAVGKGVCP